MGITSCAHPPKKVGAVACFCAGFQIRDCECFVPSRQNTLLLEELFQSAQSREQVESSEIANQLEVLRARRVREGTVRRKRERI
jgi:hypothetical protein